MLHQRYAEFSSNLVSSMAAVFGTEAKSSEDISLAKRRNTLRLLAEMYLCGLYGDLNILLDIVRGLVGLLPVPLTDPSSNSSICMTPMPLPPLRAPRKLKGSGSPRVISRLRRCLAVGTGETFTRA